jgi:hypothetical protein
MRIYASITKHGSWAGSWKNRWPSGWLPSPADATNLLESKRLMVIEFARLGDSAASAGALGDYFRGTHEKAEGLLAD